jgi:hypothetical protein
MDTAVTVCINIITTITTTNRLSCDWPTRIKWTSRIGYTTWVTCTSRVSYSAWVARTSWVITTARTRDPSSPSIDISVYIDATVNIYVNISIAYPPASIRAAVTYCNSPVACVWIVTNGNTPSCRSGVIMHMIPSWIDIAGTVNNCPAVNITADISRCVAYINNFRCMGIDIDIFHMVDRGTWRHSIYHLWYRYAHCPRPQWTICDKPNAVMAAVIVVAISDYRVGSVESIIHIRIFNLCKLGVAIIYYNYLGFAAFYSCCLRNIGVKHSFPCFSRSCNIG